MRQFILPEHRIYLLGVTTVFLLFSGVAGSSPQARAGTILGAATNAGGSEMVPAPVPLVDGVLAYEDQNHVLLNVPSALFDSDNPELLQLPNEDRTSDSFEHQVTVNRLSIIYMGLDERIQDAGGGSRPLAWMQDSAMTDLPGKFYPTGRRIDLDEGNDGSVDQTFALWATIAPPGVYRFHEQAEGDDRNMYLIMADNTVVPEPASWALLLFGACGLRRNRRPR